MIIRVLGAGQWRVADDLLGKLNGYDDQVQSSLEANDQAGLDAALGSLVDEIRRGEALGDEDLADSDLIVPDAGSSLDEVRQWLADSGSSEGLIPD